MSTTPRQIPEATGMKSMLKYTVLPLVLVVVVVFAFTLISLGVNTDSNLNDNQGTTYSPPLFFTLTDMAFNPTADTLAERTFPGFYEPTGGHQIPVSFWFHNPHPVPVQVAILGRSCTSCSSARLAIVPTEMLRTLAAGRVALAGGAVAPESPDHLTSQETAALATRLQWQDFDLEQPDKSIEVPPGSEEQPTWGVLQFGISIAAVGPKPLMVNVGLAAGDNSQVPMPFRMVLIGSNPFEVAPSGLQLGDLQEGAGSVTRNLIYWSSTRGPSTEPPLSPPTPTVSGQDAFLQVDQPIPLSREEMKQLAVQLTVEGKGGPVRVRGAYRVPVTVHRHAPGKPSPGSQTEPDIGPFSKSIAFTAPGTSHTVSVPVTATVVGLVGLIGAESADLKHFNGRVGEEKSFSLASDRDNLTLRVLTEEARPQYLKATLDQPRKQSGRQFWTLKVGVPPEALVGSLPADSVIVLEAKTSDGVRKVRIPVKGVAFAGAR